MKKLLLSHFLFLISILSLPKDLFSQNVGIGTITPATKLHVVSSVSNVATFSGTSSMYITLAEGASNRGYIGSFAGNPEDVDFGTYGGNTTGKLHLTIQDVPKLTVDATGNVGIGTTTPVQLFDVNGGIRIGNTNINTGGSIRFNAGKFEGHNGAGWTSFDQLPSQTMVASYTFPNIALENLGYSFMASIPNTGIRQSITGTVADSWLSNSTSNAISPGERLQGSAIWNGSNMIVWGGANLSGIFLNTGAAFNPVTNLWSGMSTTNAPSGRAGNSAVWTGTEMIIWGGYDGINFLNTGAKYNSSTNTWTTMSTVNAPIGDLYNTVCWTGTEMIVWGGDITMNTYTGTGARYNPSTNTWTALPTLNAPSARTNASVVWTGTDMIVWGGYDGVSYFNNGAKYNPSTNVWTPLPALNAPTGRVGHTAVWTGTDMIIWGGGTNSTTNTGAKYNPGSNTWSAISITNAPAASFVGHTAVWTGSEMIIWAVYSTPPNITTAGGRYNSATNTWASVTGTNAPPASLLFNTVWTGNEMIVFGGEVSTGILQSGGRYYPTALPGYTTSVENTGSIYLYSKQ